MFTFQSQIHTQPTTLRSDRKGNSSKLLVGEKLVKATKHRPSPSLAPGSFDRNLFVKLSHQVPWILSQVHASWTPTLNEAFGCHQGSFLNAFEQLAGSREFLVQRRINKLTAIRQMEAPCTLG